MKYSEIRQFTQKARYRIDVSLSYVLDWLSQHEKDYRLDLSPDYQRGHVWTDEQSSRYIEYLIQGGISAREFFFNCSGWDTFDPGPLELVDGKQRLHAIVRFLNGELPAFGHTIVQFEDRKSLERNVGIVISVNDLKTRAEVMQWYVDMNAGGTVHSCEEIERVRTLIESGETKYEIQR